MDLILQLLLQGLELIFGVPWVAPLLITPAMFGWAGYLWISARRRTQPYLNAAKVRVRALETALGDDPDPIAERQAFSANYGDVAGALNADAPGAPGIVLAWREFHESIVDETESPIRNTARPTAFFYRAAPKQVRLAFWSNVLVGIGLVLTFLGLIVALHKASSGMAGTDPAVMQASLRGLLVVAGAKFFTSVAGVGSSVMLRFAESGLQKKTNAINEALCTLLERGMLYVPPQRLAVEQLDVMREQRDQLKAFNTDFALQLSERMGAQFQQAIAPVTASLGQLNDNMSTMSQGLGQGAAKAIEEASGGELRALGQTLSTLGERLDALSSSVGSSGEDAARQIRAAGADFAQAATDIREAFDRLTGQVDGMGERFSSQGEAMAQAQSDSLERMLSSLESAQTKSADAIADAVSRLQGAGVSAAETMQKEVSAAMAAGVAASQETFRAALEESGEGLRGVAAGLAKAVSDAAGEVDRAGQGVGRSGESAVRTARLWKGSRVRPRQSRSPSVTPLRASPPPPRQSLNPSKRSTTPRVGSYVRSKPISRWMLKRFSHCATWLRAFARPRRARPRLGRSTGPASKASTSLWRRPPSSSERRSKARSGSSNASPKTPIGNWRPRLANSPAPSRRSRNTQNP